MALFSRDAAITGFVDDTHAPKAHSWKRVNSRFGGRFCIGCGILLTGRTMRRWDEAGYSVPPCTGVVTDAIRRAKIFKKEAKAAELRQRQMPPCVVIGTFRVLNDAGEELGSV